MAVKILTFTTLYPNASQPNHGIFVENRLRNLLSDSEMEAQVVAPVPWFPFKGERFGRDGKFAAVPTAEARHGIAIRHPRYPLVPKIGMTAAPFLLYQWSKAALRDVMESGFDFDLIDAHYAYPDGVAATLLGRHFGKPVTITARGSDINHLANYAVPRRMIGWAAKQATALITVSDALRQRMLALGADPDKTHTIRNGVDLELFRPAAAKACSKSDGERPWQLLSVGNLVPLKGHDLVIGALAQLPQAELTIVGQGIEAGALRQLAERLGVAARVRFRGAVPHGEMPAIFGAADVLVLASEREGWPNVLLEAMACGTPVVAANVGGVPEVVKEAAAGRLLPARSAEAISREVTALLQAPPARAETRAYAEGFSWQETSQAQVATFQDILAPAGKERGC